MKKCLNCKQIVKEEEDCGCAWKDYRKLDKLAEQRWKAIEEEIKSYFK